ncbi:hypothetical protein CRG98_043448 [Punica granatum]|uniref:TF-B3 domain-containing protein n=1 Tax=Punica granatum TaxID=22663 RepID=A0A2I0HWQ9_PUNGR|nr:hypothetical protein CRG98_043448 [Punica granatum]
MASGSRGTRGGRHSQSQSWRNSCVLETPHFSRILNPEILQLGKLSILETFEMEYGRDLSSPTLLKVYNGKIWQVVLRKLGGSIWLCGGWRKFMKKYKMREGYSVFFRYEGSSVFDVVILDEIGMEIEYPSRSTHSRSARARRPSSVIDIGNSTEEESGDESDEPLQSSASKVKADNSGKKWWRCLEVGHSSRFGNAPEAASQFEMEHPSFQVEVDSSDAEVDGVGCQKEPKAAEKIEPSFALSKVASGRGGGTIGSSSPVLRAGNSRGSSDWLPLEQTMGHTSSLQASQACHGSKTENAVYRSEY